MSWKVRACYLLKRQIEWKSEKKGDFAIPRSQLAHMLPLLSDLLHLRTLLVVSWDHSLTKMHFDQLPEDIKMQKEGTTKITIKMSADYSEYTTNFLFSSQGIYCG